MMRKEHSIMDERELLSAAARLSAARRRRVTIDCVICGRGVTGTVRRRYCSVACKLRAARQRRDAGTAMKSHEQREKVTKNTLPPLIQRLNATREAIARGRVFEDDAATLIREEREAHDATIVGTKE
jgi:hypothetical protein